MGAAIVGRDVLPQVVEIIFCGRTCCGKVRRKIPRIALQGIAGLFT